MKLWVVIFVALEVVKGPAEVTGQQLEAKLGQDILGGAVAEKS